MNRLKLAAVAALILGASAAEAQKTTTGSPPPAATEGATPGKPAAPATVAPEAGAPAAAPETAAAPAGSEDLILASDPEGVLAALLAQGFSAVLGVDGVNDPLISGDMEGTPYTILFYGCEENVDCEWLLFNASFEMPQGANFDTINEWNQSHLVGQAYVGPGQDLFLNYFVTTTGGLTPANFADAVDWWRVALGEFKAAMGI